MSKVHKTEQSISKPEQLDLPSTRRRPIAQNPQIATDPQPNVAKAGPPRRCPGAAGAGALREGESSLKKAVEQNRQDSPSLKAEIDQLAKEKLGLLDLTERLKPIKARLAKVPGDELEALLDYMKKTLGLSAEYVKALRRDISNATKRDTCWMSYLKSGSLAVGAWGIFCGL